MVDFIMGGEMVNFSWGMIEGGFCNIWWDGEFWRGMVVTHGGFWNILCNGDFKKVNPDSTTRGLDSIPKVHTVIPDVHPSFPDQFPLIKIYWN